MLLQRYLDSLHVIQREIAFPLSILLDTQGNVISIYFGSTTPERIAEDALLANANESKRYVAAIPYPGTIFDSEVRAVHLHMAKNMEGHAAPAYLWKLRQAGLKYFPNSPSYLISHGKTALKLGKTEEAILHLKKALTHTKNKSALIKAHNSLGIAYFNSKKMEPARASFTESIKIETNIFALYHLALIDAEQGILHSAEKNLKLSIELSIKSKQISPEPWEALYKLLVHQKKIGAAKQLRLDGIKHKIWTK